VSHILFPTDLSQASRRGFEQAIHLAAELRARVTLFHKLPLGPDAPELADAPEILAQVGEEQETRARRLAQAWREWAGDRGVTVEVVFDRAPGELASAVIAFAASHSVDLLSLVGQPSPLSSLLVGRFTRQAVRRVSCPVWIQQPLSNANLRRAYA